MKYKDIGFNPTIKDEKRITSPLLSPKQDLLTQSISTRDQFTSPKLREKLFSTHERAKEFKNTANKFRVEE
jgi:hypothetical protein